MKMSLIIGSQIGATVGLWSTAAYAFHGIGLDDPDNFSVESGLPYLLETLLIVGLVAAAVWVKRRSKEKGNTSTHTPVFFDSI